MVPSMSQVAMTINGRIYRLSVEDGEKERLLQLASDVGARVDEFTKEFGQVGETRLLLLAALRLADELMDARSVIEKHTGSSLESLKKLKKTGSGSQSKGRRKGAPLKDEGQHEEPVLEEGKENIAS